MKECERGTFVKLKLYKSGSFFVKMVYKKQGGGTSGWYLPA